MPILYKIFSLFLSILVSITALANSSSTFPVTGTVHDADLQDFDHQFISFLKRWHVPGASVAIMRNDKIIAQRGYGWADVEKKEPVQPNSLFRIASVSKTFTAVTILKLVQEGKLDLEDKVFNILNDLKPLNNRPINPKLYTMKVADLLQMSSGWFSPGAGHSDPLFGPWSSKMTTMLNPELPASCETTTRFMMTMPLRQRPGTGFVYSNLDYCILGLIINKITGYPYGYDGYERYVKNEILAPLGIQNMFIGSTQSKYRTLLEVHYYRDSRTVSQQDLENSYYLPYSTTEILKKNFSNAGWVATATDLAKFIQAVHHKQILSSKSLRIMRSKPSFIPHKKNDYYTMGGKIYVPNGHPYWIQTGSFTGSNALIVTKPDDTTIVVIFNTRPDIYAFLTKFRPELRRLMISSNI